MIKNRFCLVLQKYLFNNKIWATKLKCYHFCINSLFHSVQNVFFYHFQRFVRKKVRDLEGLLVKNFFFHTFIFLLYIYIYIHSYFSLILSFNQSNNWLQTIYAHYWFREVSSINLLSKLLGILKKINKPFRYESCYG